VQTLSRINIAYSASHSWKGAHIILKRCLANTDKGMNNFLDREDDNPLVIDILLAMGFPPSSCTPLACVRLDLPAILARILSDERIEIRTNDMIPLSRAVDLDRCNMLQMLLSSLRALTCLSTLGWTLSYAIRENKPRAVATILCDERLDLTRMDNIALCTAIELGYMPIIELLCADPRMDLSIGTPKIVRVILTRPCSQLNEFCEQLPDSLRSGLPKAMKEYNGEPLGFCRMQ